MPETKHHGRGDDSAWGGNGALAYLTGLVAGVLLRERSWRVESPEGYAPVIDLVRPDGRRFRLRVEEVTE